ncbi:hypothetical protein HZA33_01750 [Candidatus Pacearchaeota archaeon]|nr:hypothetical protein [Candidatus Pacearchaeota archaeon]
MAKTGGRYDIIAIIALIIYFLAYFLPIVPCVVNLDILPGKDLLAACNLQEANLFTNLIVLIIAFLIAWPISSLFSKKPRTISRQEKNK